MVNNIYCNYEDASCQILEWNELCGRRACRYAYVSTGPDWCREPQDMVNVSTVCVRACVFCVVGRQATGLWCPLSIILDAWGKCVSGRQTGNRPLVSIVHNPRCLGKVAVFEPAGSSLEAAELLDS